MRKELFRYLSSGEAEACTMHELGKSAHIPKRIIIFIHANLSLCKGCTSFHPSERQKPLKSLIHFPSTGTPAELMNLCGATILYRGPQGQRSDWLSSWETTDPSPPRYARINLVLCHKHLWIVTTLSQTPSHQPPSPTSSALQGWRETFHCHWDSCAPRGLLWSCWCSPASVLVTISTLRLQGLARLFNNCAMTPGNPAPESCVENMIPEMGDP